MSQPLCTLASAQPAAVECHPVKTGQHYGGWGFNWWNGLGAFILWFIIIGIVTWLVIFSLKPSWVLIPGTTQVDTGKVLLASVIIALIIVIVVWLIRASLMSCYGGRAC